MKAAAIVLATASLLWTCGYAIALLYWGFADWVPNDSDGDSTAFATTVLLTVTLIPISGAIAGWVGTLRGRSTLAWLAGGILGLVFFSPGLFGIPYFISAAFMIAAALLRSMAGESRSPSRSSVSRSP
jgi:hypothetical protein